MDVIEYYNQLKNDHIFSKVKSANYLFQWRHAYSEPIIPTLEQSVNTIGGQLMSGSELWRAKN